MKDKNDRLFRGSIRAFKDEKFMEMKDIQHINLEFKNLNATLRVTTLPKDVRELFLKAGITWNPDTKTGCRLKKEIEGLEFDEIETLDENFVRIKFSGLTESSLKSKLQEAFEWLDSYNITHGEKDGKVACIFKCLTSEQLELGEF